MNQRFTLLLPIAEMKVMQMLSSSSHQVPIGLSSKVQAGGLA
jgi:hypothetical protein